MFITRISQQLLLSCIFWGRTVLASALFTGFRFDLKNFSPRHKDHYLTGRGGIR